MSQLVRKRVDVMEISLRWIRVLRRSSAGARWTAALAAVALVAASCGGAASPAASPGASATGSVAPETATPEPSEASPSAAALGELAITTTEYSFDLPQSVPAGPTSITVANDGNEEHQAQLARIAEGSTLQDAIQAVLAEDLTRAFEMLTLAGGPAAVAPGTEETMASNLEPGRYAVLCFVSAPDGLPHVAKGMAAELEVTEPAAEGPLPEGDEQVTLQDFSFTAPETLSTGPHTLAVTNDGPQPHEATIVKLAEGVTVDQIKEMMQPPPAGASPGAASPGAASPGAASPSGGPPEAPPWTPAGGMSAIAPEAEATIDVDLEPGDYAFVCFVPDPATGQPHIALGMISGFTVQ